MLLLCLVIWEIYFLLYVVPLFKLFMWLLFPCPCLGAQPLSLKSLAEGLRSNRAADDVSIQKLFSNVLCINPPQVKAYLILVYETCSVAML